MIEIEEERFLELLEIEKFLQCLEACGVDNWQWYDDAVEMYQEDDE